MAMVPDVEGGKEAAGIFNSTVGGDSSKSNGYKVKLNILSEYSFFTEYRIKETYFIVTCCVCVTVHVVLFLLRTQGGIYEKKAKQLKEVS